MCDVGNIILNSVLTFASVWIVRKFLDTFYEKKTLFKDTHLILLSSFNQVDTHLILLSSFNQVDTHSCLKALSDKLQLKNQTNSIIYG